MLNLNNTVADNTVVINGVTIGRLSDENAQKIISIIHAMENGNVEPKVSTTTTTTKATKKSSDKEFPDLGTPKATVGFCTQYKNAIRYWENGFTPDKVRFGIKSSLKESGAVWSKEYGAFVFKTIKEADNFMAEQKKRLTK